MSISIQPQSSDNASLLAAYEARVRKGALQEDDAQHRIIIRLEQLAGEVKTAKRQGLLERFLHKSTPAVRSLYVWGPVGRGKSMLMDMFYNSLGIEFGERIHFHAFMQKVHSLMHEKRQEAEALPADEDAFTLTLCELIRQYRLLCLDELQVTDVADAMILGKLFSELLKAGVTFVITSNRPPAELYKGGLQREQFLEFVRLIETQMDVIELRSPSDYRLQQIRAMEATYMTPLNEQNHRLLLDKFAQMTHYGAIAPISLEVQGRSLPVEKSYGGIAFFTFGELCEKPLGPADYLAVARRFHTVFLSAIPELGAEKRNESRRFVILIDTLYDHRVKLICTAAAAPEALYPRGDGVFEFARTVSRLAEMRSAQYLALSHIP